MERQTEDICMNININTHISRLIQQLKNLPLHFLRVHFYQNFIEGQKSILLNKAIVDSFLKMI